MGHKHYNWEVWDDPKSVAASNLVLDKEIELIKNCSPFLGSKQANKSFHNVKSKYCPKRVNFANSASARFALAVLSHFSMDKLEDVLRTRLGISRIHPTCCSMLRTYPEQQRKLAIKKHTPDCKAATTRYRKIVRQLTDFQTKGREDSKIPGKKPAHTGEIRKTIPTKGHRQINNSADLILM
jgi:hypothetical protein